MQRRGWLLVFVLTVLAPAWADAKNLIIRQRVTGSPSAAPQEQMLYWTDTMRVTDETHRRSIVDFNAHTLTSVDKDRKTYTVRSFDELRKQGEQATRHFESMPKEAKKHLAGMDTPVTLRPTGTTQTITGYEAKEYAIGGGPYSGSLWATEAIDLGPRAQEWRELAAAISGGPGPAGQLAEAMTKIKGFPLRIAITTAVAGKQFTVTTEAVEITEKAAPPDVLTVPEGFTKVGGGR